MGKRLLGVLTILMMTTGNFSSCKQKEINVQEELKAILSVVHDESASIFGKWKLVKEILVFTSNGPKLFDYSKKNIVYEFKENGVLTISGVSHDTGLDGEHFYSIEDDESGGTKLTIGLTWWPYSVNSKELVLRELFSMVLLNILLELTNKLTKIIINQ